MLIIGIDPSITKLGITLITGPIEQPEFKCQRIIHPDKKASSDERYEYMITNVIRFIRATTPELVTVEYPFKIQGHAKVLVEVFGAIRYHCLRTQIPFLAISQSHIKKFATSSGNAEKSDMRMRAYKEFSLDLNEDEADSFWIALMGHVYLYGSKVKFRQDSIDDMIAKENKVKKIKVKK